MPYISKDRRLPERTPENVGELTWLLTENVIQYLESKPEIRYADLADVNTAFENASKEFYRRVVAFYEDKKIKQNGDVYEGLLEKIERECK